MTWASGRVLITSFFVSQPLRAEPMPKTRSWSPAVEWASGLIEHRTPFSLASGHQRQSMSSRRGLALSSMIVPVSAAASMMAGMFTRKGSRVSRSRPVRWPSMVT